MASFAIRLICGFTHKDYAKTASHADTQRSERAIIATATCSRTDSEGDGSAVESVIEGEFSLRMA